MAKIDENEQIGPFLPPRELENGMDLGEMLFEVINLCHGHEKIDLGRKMHSKCKGSSQFLRFMTFPILKSQISYIKSSCLAGESNHPQIG